jgi:hypothetical protein
LPLEIAIEKGDQVLLAILLEHGGFSVGHRRIAHHPDHEHDDDDFPPTILEYSVWVNNSEAFEIIAECFGLPTEERDRATVLRLLASRAAGTLPVEGRRPEYVHFAIDSRSTWSRWLHICESGASGVALTLSDVKYLLNVPRKVKALLQAALWARRPRPAGSEFPAFLQCAVVDAIQLVDAHWFNCPGGLDSENEVKTSDTTVLFRETNGGESATKKARIN